MAIPETGEQNSIKMLIDYASAAQAIAVSHANQAAVQVHDNEFYLTLFHVSPPVLVGTVEDQIKQLNNIDRLMPDCIARVNMTPTFARQLLAALKTQIDQYDKVGGNNDAERET